MRAYQFLNETKTTLSALYKNGLPDRDEQFWDEVTRSDLDIPLEINKIAPYKLGIILTSQYRVEHIDELVLTGEQKRIINRYKKDPNLSDSIIVMSDGRIIDGNHRALAAYLTKRPINYIDLSELNDEQPVTEGKLNELRDRMYQYIKSIVPTWPDYVVQDLLYANRGKGNTGNDGIPIKNDILDLLKAEGLTPNTKWQLIPNMKFSMDMWAEHTLRKLKGRVGGSSDMGMNIPRDAERHTTQAALAQQQGGVRKEPVIIIKTPQGYELLEGWHRTIQHFAMYPNGYVGPAYVAQSNQPVAEDNASPTKISFKVKKGRGRFATEMIVNGQQAGVYQYVANTGRSIAEVFPEFRSQGLGKILVLHAIYTAAKLGLDFQEDESRTAAYDNVLDSLSSNGYIVDDDGYWYVTGEGEQYLQQALKNKAQPVAEDKMISNGKPVENITVYHGGKQPITKFNIPSYGVFFTPHKDWAEQYGTVVTAAKIQSPNVYIVSSDGKGFDNEVLDALFRRDYASLTKIIKLLMSRGYTALQTQTDTEMLCVFPGTNIQIVDSSDETDREGKK